MVNEDTDGPTTRIRSYEDLAAYIESLEYDLRYGDRQWENTDLAFYLNAMSRWVGSIRQLYRNTDRELPEQPTWEFIADMLKVAGSYE